jgi:hypothetical protein
MTRLGRTLLTLAVLLLPLGTSISAAGDDDGCRNDSKLIGRIELSTAEGPDTWWGLTRDGMLARGIAEEDFEAQIEEWFGQTFSSLDQAITALVDAVRPFDKNGNNYVCASTVRGTRAFLDDPLYTLIYFRVVDDKDSD